MGDLDRQRRAAPRGRPVALPRRPEGARAGARRREVQRERAGGLAQACSSRTTTRRPSRSPWGRSATSPAARSARRRTTSKTKGNEHREGHRARARRPPQREDRAQGADRDHRRRGHQSDAAKAQLAALKKQAAQDHIQTFAIIYKGVQIGEAPVNVIPSMFTNTTTVTSAENIATALKAILARMADRVYLTFPSYDRSSASGLHVGRQAAPAGRQGRQGRHRARRR